MAESKKVIDCDDDVLQSQDSAVCSSHVSVSRKRQRCSGNSWQNPKRLAAHCEEQQPRNRKNRRDKAAERDSLDDDQFYQETLHSYKSSVELYHRSTKELYKLRKETGQNDAKMQEVRGRLDDIIKRNDNPGDEFRDILLETNEKIEQYKDCRALMEKRKRALEQLLVTLKEQVHKLAEIINKFSPEMEAGCPVNVDG